MTQNSFEPECIVKNDPAFPEKLNLFGHHNWILVVDKAFPAQTASGIEVINSGEGL